MRCKAYLIGFLDDATRVVPFAAFALSENVATFMPPLQQAIMRQGVPKRLYVDNGSAYRSQNLQLVCAKLGITLIHARPYSPEGKGKQERFFRTVRLQLMPTLTAAVTQSVAALNARLLGWVEDEYHRAPHRGLGGLTPLDACASRAKHVEHVGGRADIADMFLFEQRRKVAHDRTVSLNGAIFEVDAVLIGTSVTLRYDPARPQGTVQVWGSGGQRFTDAHRSMSTPIALSNAMPLRCRNCQCVAWRSHRRERDNVTPSLWPYLSSFLKRDPGRRAVPFCQCRRTANLARSPHRTARHRPSHR